MREEINEDLKVLDEEDRISDGNNLEIIFEKPIDERPTLDMPVMKKTEFFVNVPEEKPEIKMIDTNVQGKVEEQITELIRILKSISRSFDLVAEFEMYRNNVLTPVLSRYQELEKIIEESDHLANKSEEDFISALKMIWESKEKSSPEEIEDSNFDTFWHKMSENQIGINQDVMEDVAMKALENAATGFETDHEITSEMEEMIYQIRPIGSEPLIKIFYSDSKPGTIYTGGWGFGEMKYPRSEYLLDQIEKVIDDQKIRITEEYEKLQRLYRSSRVIRLLIDATGIEVLSLRTDIKIRNAFIKYLLDIKHFFSDESAKSLSGNMIRVLKEA